MEKININGIKITLLTIIGAVSSAITGLAGGWDMALQTLIIFMAIDYCLGLVVAGVFHKSNKSDTGRLESYPGWKGIVKKMATIALVGGATQLDKFLGFDYIRYGMIVAFLTNEGLSIIENAGLMGLKMPRIFIDAIEILNKDNEEKKKE